jgi:hypothetical protein
MEYLKISIIALIAILIFIDFYYYQWPKFLYCLLPIFYILYNVKTIPYQVYLMNLLINLSLVSGFYIFSYFSIYIVSYFILKPSKDIASVSFLGYLKGSYYECQLTTAFLFSPYLFFSFFCFTPLISLFLLELVCKILGKDHILFRSHNGLQAIFLEILLLILFFNDFQFNNYP